jgi:dTDP-4-amino-4,6-dideoxygalactose transaminase
MTTTRTTVPLTRPQFDDEERRLIDECLASGWVTQGKMTRQFELLMSARHKVSHALACNSCTSALHLSTTALGLGPGDEVIVPAFTWVTSAHCAEYVGAKAVFCDIELATFNIDPGALEAAITPATRAVVVVHLFGLAAKMDAIMAIARRHNLRIIEDAACAIGTAHDGVPVGGIGDLGCFSFHPRKVITTGEGGMVTTNDAELAAKVGSLRNHGTSAPPGPETAPQPYTMGRFEALGFNFRLSDIQGAVGVAQMAKLDGLVAERVSRAHRYDAMLAGAHGVATPVVPARCGHTYQSYVIRVTEGGTARRNRVMEMLATERIQTRPGTHAAHRLGYYTAKYGIRPEAFPNACLAEDLTITLPIFPGMTDSDQDFIVDHLTRALAQGTEG